MNVRGYSRFGDRLGVCSGTSSQFGIEVDGIDRMESEELQCSRRVCIHTVWTYEVWRQVSVFYGQHRHSWSQAILQCRRLEKESQIDPSTASTYASRYCRALHPSETRNSEIERRAMLGGHNSGWIDGHRGSIHVAWAVWVSQALESVILRAMSKCNARLIQKCSSGGSSVLLGRRQSQRQGVR